MEKWISDYGWDLRITDISIWSVLFTCVCLFHGRNSKFNQKLVLACLKISKSKYSHSIQCNRTSIIFLNFYPWGKKFRLCAGAVLKHMPNHIDYKLQADKGRKSKVRVQGHWWNLQAVKYPRKMTKIKTKVESAKLIKPAAKKSECR